MKWWSRASIRLRLTAWYSAAMTLMLIAYATATFVAVRHEFHEGLEDEGHVEAPGAAMSVEERVEEQLGEILVVLVLGLPVVVLVAGLGGYLLARRALAPIDQLAEDARRITAERLHQRLSVSNEHDEIGRLTAVINGTFARLDASFDQLRRFTSDASHELRTPLSVIRGIGELGLDGTLTPAEYKEAIGSMLEEVDRLTRLIDTLLRLSRGESGTTPLTRELVDLGELARDVATSLGILADERDQRLEVNASSGIHVSADRIVLRDAIANVVDNAIKYGPVGSTIEIRVVADADAAQLTVTDEGPGIATEHQARIFDRFYRVAEDRSRETGGSGLGLAIAKWAVEANGGTISVEATGRGSTFRLRLPRASADALA